MYQLARCWDYGSGVKRNDVQALTWYRKAAEFGNPHAQSAIASFYRKGRVVEKDPEKAMYWDRKAVSQGLEEVKEWLIDMNLWDEEK